MRRFVFSLLMMTILMVPVSAKPINWVDFQVPYESLKYAMDVDIQTFEEEKHLDWVHILAVAACRTGGKCDLSSVKQAVKDMKDDKSPAELLGKLYQYYDYYREAYGVILGGLMGSFSIEKDGKQYPTYGLKAFSPIAAGFYYNHCDDFGARRTFGYERKHLGHDMMGSLGTPVVAVEGGVVEALGWNRYGGWRVGIRSFDSKRYYYYAHLQKDNPYAPGLEVGDMVQAGDLLGFMGCTGYSDEENVNNIEIVHLHFGIQLIFDESQKDGPSEIWIDPYEITKLLDSHRVSLKKNGENWERIYRFTDLDIEQLNGRP